MRQQFLRTGLSINASGSIVGYGDNTEQYLVPLVTDFSCQTRALGGYWSAGITLEAEQHVLDDWLARGVGRHIVVSNPGLATIWEGFVSDVGLGHGALDVTIGPLTQIANYVRCKYRVLDTTVTPAVSGDTAFTAWGSGPDSITRYGQIEQVIQGGEAAAADALQMRDTFIADEASPNLTQRIGTGGRQSVTLSCLGYVHWLNAYNYTEVLSGTQNIDVKINAILDADPNGIFASTNADITVNALPVPRYDDDGMTAWDVIIGLVARGDVNENRYVLGVYDNRKVVYKQVPSPDTPLYTWASRDPKQRYYQNDTILVAHHDIKAAEWIYTTDFLVGQVWPGGTYRDPRLIFIENTRYRLGQPVDIQGGSIDRIDQAMAQMGLGGMT